jgi:hypothetical protein
MVVHAVRADMQQRRLALGRQPPLITPESSGEIEKKLKGSLAVI